MIGDVFSVWAALAMPIHFYDRVLVCAYRFPIWKHMFRGSGLCVSTGLIVAKGVSLLSFTGDWVVYSGVLQSYKGNDHGKTKTRTKQGMKAMTI
jgi:hypothetical protein